MDDELQLNFYKDNSMLHLYVSYPYSQHGDDKYFDWDEYELKEHADDIRDSMDAHRNAIKEFFDSNDVMCSVYDKLKKTRSFMKKKGDARVYGKWSILTFKSNGYSQMDKVIEKLKQMCYKELPAVATK